MGVIHVIDHGGERHILEALEGWRVMEIIRDWNLPLKGTCGGACECAGQARYGAADPAEFAARLPDPLSAGTRRARGHSRAGERLSLTPPVIPGLAKQEPGSHVRALVPAPE
jgi:hypothetical protein